MTLILNIFIIVPFIHINIHHSGIYHIDKINKDTTKDKQDNNNNKDNTNRKEENDKKVKIELNNDNPINDKISFCHYILRKGVDIDITTVNCFNCREHVNSKILLLPKKYSAKETLLFYDESYLYLLKDDIVNKSNEKLRRIKEISYS